MKKKILKKNFDRKKSKIENGSKKTTLKISNSQSQGFNEKTKFNKKTCFKRQVAFEMVSS
jgi:hypothetical protein